MLYTLGFTYERHYRDGTVKTNTVIYPKSADPLKTGPTGLQPWNRAAQ